MILEVVAIVLIILFSIVSAVLLIPFHVTMTGSVSQSARKFDVALSWLGLTLWHSKPTKPKKVREEKKSKTKKRQLNLSRATRILSLLRNSVPALLILARSVKRAVHLHSLEANFAFGLGDPADTAVVAGYLWSFAWILNRLPSVSLTFQPDFDATSFDGSMKADARVRMVFLVVGFLRAYSKKEFRKLIKEVRR